MVFADAVVSPPDVVAVQAFADSNPSIGR